jgi:hypothetical protein
VRRRAFIAGLGSAAAWPVVARGQQAMPVVGYVGIGSPDSYETDRVGAFRKGLSETGYVDGDNVTIELAQGQFEQLPNVATELTPGAGSIDNAAACRGFDLCAAVRGRVQHAELGDAST